VLDLRPWAVTERIGGAVKTVLPIRPLDKVAESGDAPALMNLVNISCGKDV
jgi:hypothetical protein